MSRPVGSKNLRHRAVFCAVGGATSAAKMSGRSGIAEYATKCWIPGEGWVRWTELQKQIDRAFQDWRMRRALAGKQTFDAHERRTAHIAECMSKRAHA